MKTEVLIIGAGPTGLSLACQLLRYGIDFVIVEQNDGVTPFSKAVGVQARTLEIYEQIGLAEKALAQGAIVGKVCLLMGGYERAKLDLSHLGEGLSRYPFVLLLEQSKNERLLYDFLQSHQHDVQWQSRLLTFAQSAHGVTAQIQASDGTQQAIEARYLVGCDGAKSTTRHALQLEFEGSTFERTFYVADVRVNWERNHDAAHFFLTDNSFVMFFPLRGADRYRIVGVFPEAFAKAEGDVDYDEIEARIKGEAQIELDIFDVQWFSTYKVHTRHVSEFSSGRCFLAGDSAHIHSPAGAQGMNTGIGDAYNLAWKLALVLREQANEKLLASYNEERLENAKTLLQTTDRLFDVVAGSNWVFAALRHVLPAVAEHALGFESIKHFIFPRLSQIGIHYRHSSLSQHAGDEHFSIKAGDRMPFLEDNGQTIYDYLKAPKFHWLLFSDSPAELSAATQALKNHYGAWIDIFAWPLSPQVRATFGTNAPFSALLRPDNHLAFLQIGTDVSAPETYWMTAIKDAQETMRQRN